MNKPLAPAERGFWTRLRIWWWKWRYVEQMLDRLGERSSDTIRTAKHCANEGWLMALDDHKGDVQAALNEDPSESADSELSYWTD